MAIYEFKNNKKCTGNDNIPSNGLRKDSYWDRLSEEIVDIFEKPAECFGKEDLDYFLIKSAEQQPQVNGCLVKVTEESARYTILLVPLNKADQPFYHSSHKVLGRRVFARKLSTAFLDILNGEGSLIYRRNKI